MFSDLSWKIGFRQLKTRQLRCSDNTTLLLVHLKINLKSSPWHVSPKEITIHNKTWDFECMSERRLGVAGVILNSFSGSKNLYKSRQEEERSHILLLLCESFTCSTGTSWDQPIAPLITSPLPRHGFLEQILHSSRKNACAICNKSGTDGRRVWLSHETPALPLHLN